ncbi:LOW QUALITY PROTEIN: hypothetical protein U9M48_000426 [Paspalum notatum var. saurae]|uniref:Uncharacterized protein n=1 Tax=Paspalum notatum var. saurae TaxID=547442 RepID=A0AAQ3PI39_PASNO
MKCHESTLARFSINIFVSLAFSLLPGVLVDGLIDPQHGLNRDSWSECHEHTPVVELELLLWRTRSLGLQSPLPAHLIQHEQHRRAEHVAIIAEDTPARRHLLRPELEHLVKPVHDPHHARVHHPEEVVVPFGVVDAELRERVHEAPLHVVHDERRDMASGGATAEAGLGEDGLLGVRNDRLRCRHDFEDRQLHWSHGVGAHDDGRRAVAEEHLVGERLQVPVLWPGEEHEGELGAYHQHARAAVVLGEVLGEAQGGGAGEAAVEVEHATAHGGAEAQEVDQAEVHAGDVRAGVGGDDEVGDVFGRAAPLSDRLPAGCRGELRHRGLDDVEARVQGRRGPVEELRVGAHKRLVVVEETPSLDLVFELLVVLTLGEAEVIVWVYILRYARFWVSRAHCQHCCKAIGARYTAGHLGVDSSHGTRFLHAEYAEQRKLGYAQHKELQRKLAGDVPISSQIVTVAAATKPPQEQLELQAGLRFPGDERIRAVVSQRRDWDVSCEGWGGSGKGGILSHEFRPDYPCAVDVVLESVHEVRMKRHGQVHLAVSLPGREHNPAAMIHGHVIDTARRRLGAPRHVHRHNLVRHTEPKVRQLMHTEHGAPTHICHPPSRQRHHPLDPRPDPGHRRRYHLPHGSLDRPRGAEQPRVADELPGIGARYAPPDAVADVAVTDGGPEAAAQVHLEQQVRVFPGGEPLGAHERRPADSRQRYERRHRLRRHLGGVVRQRRQPVYVPLQRPDVVGAACWIGERRSITNIDMACELVTVGVGYGLPAVLQRRKGLHERHRRRAPTGDRRPRVQEQKEGTAVDHGMVNRHAEHQAAGVQPRDLNGHNGRRERPGVVLRQQARHLHRTAAASNGLGLEEGNTGTGAVDDHVPCLLHVERERGGEGRFQPLHHRGKLFAAGILNINSCTGGVATHGASKKESFTAFFTFSSGVGVGTTRDTESMRTPGTAMSMSISIAILQ